MPPHRLPTRHVHVPVPFVALLVCPRQCWDLVPLWLTVPVSAVCVAQRYYAGARFFWDYGLWSAILIIARVLESAIDIDYPGRLTFRYTFALLMYAHITLLLVWIGLALVWLTLSAIINPAKNLVMAAAMLAPIYSLRATWCHTAFLRKDVADTCTEALNAVLLSKVAGYVQSQGAMKSVNTANGFIRQLVCPKGAPIPSETIFRAMDPRNWRTATLSIVSGGGNSSTPRSSTTTERLGSGQYTFGVGKHDADDAFVKVHKEAGAGLKRPDGDTNEDVYITMDELTEVEICCVEESLAAQAKRAFNAIDTNKTGITCAQWNRDTVIKQKFVPHFWLTKLDDIFNKCAVSSAAAGVADTDEGTAELKALFDTLDKDTDDAVSSEEWGHAVGKNKAAMAKYFVGDMAEIGKAFSRIDTNNNDCLTWAEFSGYYYNSDHYKGTVPITRDRFAAALDKDERLTRTRTTIVTIKPGDLKQNSSTPINDKKFGVRLSDFIPLGSKLRGIKVRQRRSCGSTHAQWSHPTHEEGLFGTCCCCCLHVDTHAVPLPSCPPGACHAHGHRQGGARH